MNRFPISLQVAPFAALTLVLLTPAAPGPQQNGASLPMGDVFSGTGNAPVYSDRFSGGCRNTSPYQGMNPLVCYGVMAPADSRGQCSLRGMRLLRKAGNTCYYCQPIRPPIKGIIIPLDQLQQARAQGFSCGVDQANPNCMAVCTRNDGGQAYIPPKNNPLKAGGSTNRDRRWPGPATIPGDPCHAPGGYDYCQNPAGTQPAGCDCSKRLKVGITQESNLPQPSQARPQNNPSDDALQYGQGVIAGLSDCIKGLRDLLAAGAAMARLDFVTAAQTLGLQPGQSLILRELATPRIGIAPYEAGRIAGRRICAYGVAPGGVKAIRSLRGIRTPGVTPYNPLRGSAITEAVSSDAAPGAEPSLPGKWVQTPRGPVQLGKLLGSGAFGNVYEMPEQPGRVIKIPNAKPNSAPSFPRQVAGSQQLQNAGIPTPKIYDPATGAANEPPLLTMDNVFSKWPGAKIVRNIPDLTAPQITAIRNLHNQLGKNGLVWADGNSPNIFFFDGPQGLQAGVVDADMIFEDSAFQSQDKLVKNTLGNILLINNQGSLVMNGLNAQAVMNALFHIRYQ